MVALQGGVAVRDDLIDALIDAVLFWAIVWAVVHAILSIVKFLGVAE